MRLTLAVSHIDDTVLYRKVFKLAGEENWQALDEIIQTMPDDPKG